METNNNIFNVFKLFVGRLFPHCARSVLVCIEADFLQASISQHFSRSTIISYFCTGPSSNIQLNFIKYLGYLPSKSRLLRKLHVFSISLNFDNNFLRIIVSRFFVNIDEQFHFDHPEKRQDTSFCRAYPTGTTILVPPRIFRKLRDAIKHAVVKLVVHPAVTIASTN